MHQLVAEIALRQQTQLRAGVWNLKRAFQATRIGTDRLKTLFLSHNHFRIVSGRKRGVAGS